MVMSIVSKRSKISPPSLGRTAKTLPLRLIAALGTRIGAMLVSRSLRASRSWSESVDDRLLSDFGPERDQINQPSRTSTRPTPEPNRAPPSESTCANRQ